MPGSHSCWRDVSPSSILGCLALFIVAFPVWPPVAFPVLGHSNDVYGACNEHRDSLKTMLIILPAKTAAKNRKKWRVCFLSISGSLKTDKRPRWPSFSVSLTVKPLLGIFGSAVMRFAHLATTDTFYGHFWVGCFAVSPTTQPLILIWKFVGRSLCCFTPRTTNDTFYGNFWVRWYCARRESPANTINIHLLSPSKIAKKIMLNDNRRSFFGSEAW